MIKTKNGKTAPQYVKQAIIQWEIKHYNLPYNVDGMSGEEIDELYDKMDISGEITVGANEMRHYWSDENILPARKYSRHYDCKEVAYQCTDGTWIGWTYWYGGGKHGEPNAIDWINDAYFVECVEEEKLVVVRSFSIEEDNTNANPNA